MNALTNQVLDVELVDSESAVSLLPFLGELQELFAVEVLLSDDQDRYENAATDLGLNHGICRAHVNRNVAKLVGAVGQQGTIPTSRQSSYRPRWTTSLTTCSFSNSLSLCVLVTVKADSGSCSSATVMLRRLRPASVPRCGTAFVWPSSAGGARRPKVAGQFALQATVSLATLEQHDP